MIHPQLPLSLPFGSEQQFDTFIGQAQACAAAIALADAPPGEPTFLVGAAGSGKTHLLLAAVARARAAGRDARYLPLRALVGVCAEAFAGQEAAVLLALDDVDAIAGRAADEEALFHLHNRACAGGVGLLYAARHAPLGGNWRLPDLRSRLAQCQQQPLQALDDAARRQVLVRRAERRGLQLEPAVLDWMLTHVGRDLAGLTGLLERLDRVSLASRRRLTIPLLKQVLGGD